jgi:translation initiation factor 1
VTRLFAGTPWDRPPICDRCGRLESECSCPPPAPEVKRIPPEQQTARLITERRVKGKLVTVIAGLDLGHNDLSELATRLKNACGAGGTVKNREIELQGDHLQAAERALQAIGYKTEARGA